MVLNTIRAYYLKHKKKYGTLVIATDNSSWRKQYYKEYKFKRRESKSNDTRDWNGIFEVLNGIKEDLVNFFPYKVISVAGAEADDIIGALVEETQEFGKHEEVMIISGDHDFIQLHRYNNVKQFSPNTKKMVKVNNPDVYLMEHILKGDSGDGVPNVLSPDNTFVDKIRQKPITKKFLEKCASATNIEDQLDSTAKAYYQRNKKMIDLRNTPDDIREEILKQSSDQEDKSSDASLVLNYLISKRCKNLIECVGDFL